jgi:ribosomal protein S18 acetylase RimI-like enzyme
VIRPYRPSDRDAILAITVRAFDGVSIDQNIERRYGPIAGVGWYRRKSAHLESDLAAEAAGVLVAEVEGRVVGYVTTRTDTKTGIGRIPNLAVHPEHQGKGLGRQLLEAALDRLREEGMAFARIETLEQNERCMALYPRLGFEEVARQVHYIRSLDDRGSAGE